MAVQPRNANASLLPGATLRVRAYDKAASMLLSLLILVGVVVVCLVVAWFSARVFKPQQAIPVVLEDIAGGFESGTIGEGMQIEAPDTAEIAQETDLEVTELSQVLEAIDSVIADREADLDEMLIDAEATEEQTGGGRSTGSGDQLAAGRGNGGAGIPRHERWEIRFDEGRTLDEYARQLDFFGIELGVLQGLGEVAYAYKLQQPKPETRIGNRAAEERMYMTWSRGGGGRDASSKRLEAADRQLLARAGIDATGRDVLQFYPADTENQLAFYEREYRGLEAKAIRRTRFGVRKEGASYQFFVIDQTPL